MEFREGRSEGVDWLRIGIHREADANTKKKF
jgi:hypothetical protein